MRRSAGVVLSAVLLALVPALTPNIVFSAPSSAVSGTYDLASAAFRAVFGETSDARATLAAAYGDRAGESPLRDLAIAAAPRREPLPPAFAASFLTMPTFALALPEHRASLAASNAGGSSTGVYGPSSGRFVPVAFYAPVPPVELDVPQQLDADVTQLPAAAPSGEAASAAASSVAPVTFGDSAFAEKRNPALPSGFEPTSVLVPVSMHLGRLQVDGRVAGAQTQVSTDSAQDNGYGAGANFDLRAGTHRVNVDVSSSYEHLMRDDSTAYSPALPSNSQWEIGGDAAPAIPNYADMSKLALGANLAVPVTHTMTLNFNYSAQRLLGEYGLPGLANLDAVDNSLGGNLTFAIPRWSSQISVSASQYHYQDNIAPANTFSDLRGNVNFTVKF
jgi:hypothetical protein